jgi:hypothetical protein
MTDEQLRVGTMRTLRFHRYGEPTDVLRLEKAAIPSPVRVTSACGCMRVGSTLRIGPCAEAYSRATSRGGSALMCPERWMPSARA